MGPDQESRVRADEGGQIGQDDRGVEARRVGPPEIRAHHRPEQHREKRQGGGGGPSAADEGSHGRQRRLGGGTWDK